MKSVIFLSLCAAGYVLLLGWIIWKLKDIGANPKKYNVIHGGEKYRDSFWYERGYKRYGKHYYASLYVGIPWIMLFPNLYIFLGKWVQKLLFVPEGTRMLSSNGLAIGAIACTFFSFGLIEFILFYGKFPIMVAARLYFAGQCEHQPTAWKNMFATLLVCSALCLPVMALGLNAYSYADEEKIVTHTLISPMAEEIPYESIESGTTDYSCNKNYTEFSLHYEITLEDGTELWVDDFGTEGMRYINAMLQKYQVPVEYGEIDRIIYEALKRNCNDKDMTLIDSCLTIVESNQ